MKLRRWMPLAAAGAALIGAVAGAGDEVRAQPGAPSAPSTSSAPSAPSAPSGKRVFGDVLRAKHAREAIIAMELPEARKILETADPSDVDLMIEQGRLLLHEGDYDAAAALLARPDLAALPEGRELFGIALGCARAMAATVEVRDEARGIRVRLQDDDDRALVPLLAETAEKVRAALAKDLGVELPRPLRIDLVRDQFSLAAMTGLPEEAAKTTGTVAVAKWGRVTMISPRATPRGYQWLDTLAHEMTHLALTKGTLDKAPLWLQEGVAKRQEARWREPQPLDDFPPADSIAMVGLEKGLGRPIDKLGPSIAMLPTAEQASVAFAEVTSFIRYWVRELGDDALPQLVLRLKAAPPSDEAVSRAIEEISGTGFAAWDTKWRAWLASAPRDVPPELAPGGRPPGGKEIVKRVRLGDLLDARGHARAAVMELARAQMLITADATVRCHLAAALLHAGDRAAAAPLVASASELHSRDGRWWSLHGHLHPDQDPARAFTLGVALDPLEPAVACEELEAPATPADPARAALCETARRAPK